MNPEFKTVPLFEGLTMTSAGTVIGAVDTKGYDFLAIDLVAGTGAAASTAVTTLRLCESDVLTAVSNMTAYTTVGNTPITQFVGAAAVSTSAGFVLPALSSTTQNVYRFNVDLRGRKRYIGLNFAPELQTVGVSATALLFKAETAPAMVTAGTASSGARVIVSG
jgi:hypothetical protein